MLDEDYRFRVGKIKKRSFIKSVMNWIIFPLAASLIWGIVDVIDKHVVSDELKDPLMCATFFGFISFLSLGLISLAVSNVFEISLTAKLLGMFAGAFLIIGQMFYFSALKRDKISNLAPLLSTRVLWVIILAFFILSEKLEIIQYLGISVLLLGIILISFKRGEKYKFNISVIIFLFATLSWACRDILFKISKNVGNVSAFPILFWLSLSAFITSFILLIVHHPHIIRKARKGAEHIILNIFLYHVALLSFLYGVSQFKVSLVAAMGSLSPLVIFFIVLIFTKIKPSIIYEKFSRTNLAIKFTATILVVIGAILMNSV